MWHHQKYTCPICQKVVAGVANFKRHARVVHLCSDATKCLICGSKFKSLDWLAVHLSKQHRADIERLTKEHFKSFVESVLQQSCPDLFNFTACFASAQSGALPTSAIVKTQKIIATSCPKK